MNLDRTPFYGGSVPSFVDTLSLIHLHIGGSYGYHEKCATDRAGHPDCTWGCSDPFGFFSDPIVDAAIYRRRCFLGVYRPCRLLTLKGTCAEGLQQKMTCGR